MGDTPHRSGGPQNGSTARSRRTPEWGPTASRRRQIGDLPVAVNRVRLEVPQPGVAVRVQRHSAFFLPRSRPVFCQTIPVALGLQVW